MKLPDANARFRGFVTLLTFVVVVAIMKVAEDVLIPIALTVLLTFLLTPFVVRLTRWGLPKTAAIILTVTIAFGVIGGVSWIVFTQAVSLAYQLPNYETNIRQKIAAIKTPDGDGGSFARLKKMIQELEHDVETPAPAPAATPPPKKNSDKNAPAEPRPVPVEVKPTQPSSLQLTGVILERVGAPLGTGAIVIVFVIAMLFQREDLRDRFINVVSAGRLNLATQALDDAARRVTRYLSMQLVVNATYGIPVGVGLYFIGVPNALLWGVLATLLRFIPFLGPWVAAAFPIALAAAVDPGWSKLLYTVAIFLVMELISNNLVEPWLYGSSTGISNLALMIAAVFWTWLWGTAGLFLSTPLTVCIMVLGKYVAGLQFISVLLGNDPVLEPSAKFYQRMLSMDSDEMRAIAFKYIEDRSLEQFYNEVFVPALLMSEQDRHNGALAEVRQKFIFETSRELIDQIERRIEAENTAGNAAKEPRNGEPRPSANGFDEERSGPVAVFGIPARDDADEVVALMLQHLLRIRGVETEVFPVTSHAEDFVRWMQQHEISLCYISALPPAALIGTRQLIRRIKENCPNTKVLVGVWSHEADYNELRMRLSRPRPDAIVTNLGDAVRQVEKFLARESPETSRSAASREELMTESDAESSEDFQVGPLGLQDLQPDELFAAVTRDLAARFDVPLSLVTISASDPQFWKARTGIVPESGASPQTSAATPAISPDETLIVEDVSKDKRLSANTLLTERGVRFYAGVPLRDHNSHVVGTLTVVDTKPRQPSTYDQALLSARAAELMETVESIQAPSAPTKAESLPPFS